MDMSEHPPSDERSHIDNAGNKETFHFIFHRSAVLNDIIKELKENKSLSARCLRMVFQVIDNQGNSDGGAGDGVARDLIIEIDLRPPRNTA